MAFAVHMVSAAGVHGVCFCCLPSACVGLVIKGARNMAILMGPQGLACSLWEEFLDQGPYITVH